MADIDRPVPKHHFTPSHVPLRILASEPIPILPPTSSPACCVAAAAISTSITHITSSLSVPPSPPSPSPLRIIQRDHHHHHHHHHHVDEHDDSRHARGPVYVPKTSLLRRSFWNTRCYCLFSALPDELLSLAFTWLDIRQVSALHGVCTRWNALSSDAALWRSCDLSRFNKLSYSAVESIIQRHGDHMESLKLCNLSALNAVPSLHPPIGASALRLSELHLCNLRTITDGAVADIAARCRQLKHVSLYGCLQLTDIAVIAITENAERLEELSVRGLIKITNKSLALLPATIKGLNIAGCKLINSVGLAHVAKRCANIERLNAHAVVLADDAVDLLSRHCNALETLHLSSANPFGGNPRMTDASIVSLRRLVHLTSLNLQGTSNITDEHMAALFSACPLLARVNVGGCYRITDDTVRAMSKLKLLTHISLFQCFHLTDDAIVHLIQRCSALQNVDLHSCVGLTSVILTALMEEAVDVALEVPVSVRSTSDDGIDRSPKLSARAAVPTLVAVDAAPLVRKYPLAQLNQLDVGSCRNIRAEDVAALRLIRPNVTIIHY